MTNAFVAYDDMLEEREREDERARAERKAARKPRKKPTRRRRVVGLMVVKTKKPRKSPKTYVSTEKPVKVIPHQGPHKTETRVFARQIHEAWCMDPKCKWYKKPAQQGVCHMVLGQRTRAYLDDAEKSAAEQLAHVRKHSKSPKDYTKQLEAQLVCALMNNSFTLDELVRLRVEVGTLKLLVEKAK